MRDLLLKYRRQISFVISCLAILGAVALIVRKYIMTGYNLQYTLPQACLISIVVGAFVLFVYGCKKREWTFLKSKWALPVVIVIGCALRFLIREIGHNYDFESYKIVGEIVARGGNVYQETARYNYGPLFMYCQGFLWKLSRVLPIGLRDNILYRYLMIAFLTGADIGITMILDKKFSRKAAVLYFLNPISIIIIGYHNQFDNWAVFLMLLAVVFYNGNEKRFSYKDGLYLLFFTLSLIMKHDFFAFPFWVLVAAGLPKLKRLLYSCLPPTLFLLSFLPYWSVGHDGIINNVFLYRSKQYAPLLKGIYQFFGVSENYYFYGFVLILCLMGWLFRKNDIQKNVMLYMICLVALSTSMTNQYLIIALPAVCVLSKHFKYWYSFYLGAFLCLHCDGFNMLQHLTNQTVLTHLQGIVDYGYTIACYLLFFIVLKQFPVFTEKIREYI